MSWLGFGGGSGEQKEESGEDIGLLPSYDSLRSFILDGWKCNIIKVENSCLDSVTFNHLKWKLS